MAVTIDGNNTPTAGGVVYGDGANYASTAAGTSGQFLQSTGSGVPIWAAAGAEIVRVARTSNTALTSANKGNLIAITSGTFTQTFVAAATLGNGWFAYIQNSGTGDITLDPDGSETIDGLTSYIMYPGEVRLVQCDGTALRTIVLTGFFAEFLTSATFSKPPGYFEFYVEVCGGGGGGGGGYRGTSGAYNTGGAGGGGGALNVGIVSSSTMPASVSVTVGAGGTAGAGTSTDDTNGGAGGAGGGSAFGNFWSGLAGGPGGGGGTGSGPANTASFSGTAFKITSSPAYNGGAGGGSPNTVTPNAGRSTLFGNGGGGGGGANIGGVGANGGANGTTTDGAGAAGGGADTNGTAGSTYGVGGGGGGGSFGVAGNGGAGGRGAGGGGGGASAYGTSGSGGVGGAGFVRVKGII